MLQGLFAQEKDLVVLNDETTYLGRVVEQKPGEYIKLVLDNSQDTLKFEMNEIDRLVKVGGLPTKDRSVLSPDLVMHHFNSRSFRLSLGGSTGGGDVAFGGLGLALHYRAHEKLLLGISSEYLGETGSGISAPYAWQKLPIYLDVIYDLEQHFKGRTALYARAGMGYSFSLDNKFTDPVSNESRTVSNGFALKTGLGYRVNLFNDMGLHFDLDYLLILDNIRDQSDQNIKSNNWSNIILSASIFF
jgi:hypothetical protein